MSIQINALKFCDDLDAVANRKLESVERGYNVMRVPVEPAHVLSMVRAIRAAVEVDAEALPADPCVGTTPDGFEAIVELRNALADLGGETDE